MEIIQRSIWLCDRDLDGRKNSCRFRCKINASPQAKLVNPEGKYTKHWFIILSKRDTQGFITVLPISSKDYQIDLNGAQQINDGDVEDSPNSRNTFPFNKDTFVLCNKPCRIPLEDLEGQEDWGRIKRDVYLNLLDTLKLQMMLN